MIIITAFVARSINVNIKHLSKISNIYQEKKTEGKQLYFEFSGQVFGHSLLRIFAYCDNAALTFPIVTFPGAFLSFWIESVFTI